MYSWHKFARKHIERFAKVAIAKQLNCTGRFLSD